MEKTRRNYRTQTYIDGNTVRKLEPAPDYRREQEEKQREEIRQRNRRMAQKNQEKSAHMDLGYVAFLSVSLLVMCVAAVLYIRLQSGITTHLKTISALESQVAELKADNDAAEKKNRDSSRSCNHQGYSNEPAWHELCGTGPDYTLYG